MVWKVRISGGRVDNWLNKRKSNRWFWSELISKSSRIKAQNNLFRSLEDNFSTELYCTDNRHPAAKQNVLDTFNWLLRNYADNYGSQCALDPLPTTLLKDNIDNLISHPSCTTCWTSHFRRASKIPRHTVDKKKHISTRQTPSSKTSHSKTCKWSPGSSSGSSASSFWPTSKRRLTHQSSIDLQAHLYSTEW